MGNIFFTADPHFGHANIIKHCKRPFSSPEEMDEAMMSNWNNVVGRKDTVYIIGDVAWGGMGKYLYNLKGNIVLIKGNHDHRRDMPGCLMSVHDLLTLKVGNRKIVLCHYPIMSWDSQFHGSLHLYGHVHGTPLPGMPPRCMDVGVDCNGFTPVALEEVINKLEG